MSFGLVQLGQTATSLKESEMSYECLTYLVNRFWLNNLASMHNHKTLFNMDISGGMPDVIIKMLAASDPGKVQLLPALPKAWPEGIIEGILCRGQIEIKSLKWSPDKILVDLVSSRKQTIELETPQEIISFDVKEGDAVAEKGSVKNSLNLKFPEKKIISMEINLK